MTGIHDKVLFVFSAIFLLSFNQACGYRILGIFPHIGKSHMYAFVPLVKELAERGHDVTVISQFPIANPPPNYRDINLNGSAHFWEPFDLELFNYPYGTDRIIRHVLSMLELFSVGTGVCAAMVQNEEVLQLQKGQFDLAIIEQFNSDCGLGIIHKLDIPFIGITSHVMMPWTIDRMGVIDNPSYVPNHFDAYGRYPSFLEVVENVILSYWYRIFYYFYVQLPERKILIDHYDKSIPELEELARNMSMVMIYTYFPLAGAVPLAPNAIEIGGIHLQKLKKLDEEFGTYLNNSKNGVIVFTMGSMLRASSWPHDKLGALQGAFEELSMYDIIWKWDDDVMLNKPKNVKLVKWLPQYEILNHKNVKVFITHAGMLGLSEAIQSGVPVVSIPMYGDQFCNAASAKDSGVGEILDYKTITKESILKAIRNVLDSKVQERSEKLADIWKDRPQSSLDTAVYWVEHIAKHGGDHLRPVSTKLPFYRYYLLDVIAFFAFGILIALYVNYKIIKAVFKWSLAGKIKKE